MSVPSLSRVSVAAVLLTFLVVTGEGLSQRDPARGGGRTAGHRAPTAPKQVSPGPAMSRPAGVNRPNPPAGGPKAVGGPQVAGGKGGAGGIQRPNVGGGPGPVAKQG